MANKPNKREPKTNKKAISWYNGKKYDKILRARQGYIYCTECKQNVFAEQVKGDVIYPGRPDLYNHTFLRCPTCKNYAGTKASSIPTPYIRKCRMMIHHYLDSFWQTGVVPRSWIYREMSRRLGWNFHSGSIRDELEATEALFTARSLKTELTTYGVKGYKARLAKEREKRRKQSKKKAQEQWKRNKK